MALRDELAVESSHVVHPLMILQDLYSSFNSQMMYFCPVDKAVCAGKNASTQAEALRMLHEYEAVGVVESLAESMRLFEVVLPRYFKGLSELEQKRVRQSSLKIELSASLLEQLNVYNKLDVEFYQHAVKLLGQRLNIAEASPWKFQLQALMKKE
jgi:ABC-type dipeptide/oligopeptide/nickel transport system ATPase subunit